MQSTGHQVHNWESQEVIRDCYALSKKLENEQEQEVKMIGQEGEEVINMLCDRVKTELIERFKLESAKKQENRGK